MNYEVDLGPARAEVEQVAVGFSHETPYSLEAILNVHLMKGWYLFKMDTYFNDGRIHGVAVFEREIPNETGSSK